MMSEDQELEEYMEFAKVSCEVQVRVGDYLLKQVDKLSKGADNETKGRICWTSLIMLIETIFSDELELFAKDLIEAREMKAAFRRPKQ